MKKKRINKIIRTIKILSRFIKNVNFRSMESEKILKIYDWIHYIFIADLNLLVKYQASEIKPYIRNSPIQPQWVGWVRHRKR